MVLAGAFILATRYSIIILFMAHNGYNWSVNLCVVFVWGTLVFLVRFPIFLFYKLSARASFSQMMDLNNENIYYAEKMF